MRYVGEREEAKDLVQKTFIQVYKGMSKLKDRDRFSTWFYRIALNICRNAARVRQRHSIVSMDGMEESELDGVLELATPRNLDPDSVVHRQNVRQLKGLSDLGDLEHGRKKPGILLNPGLLNGALSH